MEDAETVSGHGRTIGSTARVVIDEVEGQEQEGGDRKDQALSAFPKKTETPLSAPRQGLEKIIIIEPGIYLWARKGVLCEE